MTTRMRQFYHLSTSRPQLAGQLLWLLGCNHRVAVAVGDDHQGSGEIDIWGLRTEPWRPAARRQPEVPAAAAALPSRCWHRLRIQRQLATGPRSHTLHWRRERTLLTRRPCDAGPARQRLLADSTEEPRHAVLQYRPAYREHRRTGRQMIAQRQQVVLVATSAVQEQQRRARRGIVGGQEDVRPIETPLGVHGMSMSSWSGGSAAAICSRLGSSQGGNLRLRPSSSSGSSTAKPGTSVAISNNTPPGSRK